MQVKNNTLDLPYWSMARLLGVFESNTPEWHELRAKGVGGSEVGTICGLNKWDSPLSLWAKKTGRITDAFNESEAMRWGTLLESVILREFALEHPELDVYPSPGTFCHKDRDWQIANPDAIAYNRETHEWSVVEIKTSRYEDDWSETDNAIPASYRAQVLWYLETFGFGHAYVVALFAGSKMRTFHVDANDFEQEVNRLTVEKWRDYYLTNTQPDYDGAEATYETIRALHPEIDPTLDDVELGDLGVHYCNALAEYTDADQNLREMKSRVLDAMGKAKRGLVNGDWTVTRQAKGSGLPYLVNKKG
jgi:putative phage-type endonuclease